MGQGNDKSSKGLRHFSMKVCKKVEEKGRTNYNEVRPANNGAHAHALGGVISCTRWPAAAFRVGRFVQRY
jgi:hypothetical protein